VIGSGPNKKVRCALIVLPETAPTGLYGMLEVFSSDGTVWEELTGKSASDVRIKVDFVAEYEHIWSQSKNSHPHLHSFYPDPKYRSHI
jgi:hypothetical protein